MSDYIISEEQLQFYIKEPRYTQRQDMATQIRSRTLSEHDPIRLNTQPEGCDCRDCQRYRKDECPYPGSNPTIYICNSFLMDVKEHDAKVAKAERERLLDEFAKQFRSAYLFFDDIKFDETIERLRKGAP